MSHIQRTEGRRLFGADPDGYDRVRPPYPEWVFQSLSASGALFRGAATLEIGPGSGLATRALLAAGATPITLIEPDQRLADWLSFTLKEDAAERSAANPAQMIVASFEAAELASTKPTTARFLPPPGRTTLRLPRAPGIPSRARTSTWSWR